MAEGTVTIESPPAITGLERYNLVRPRIHPLKKIRPGRFGAGPSITSADYREQPECSESASFDSQSATRKFYLTDDTLRAEFEQLFLGYVYLDPTSGLFERQLPLTHPYRVWLRAAKVDWENLTEDYRVDPTGITYPEPPPANPPTVGTGPTSYDSALLQAPMATGAIATVTYERAPWHVLGYDNGTDPTEPNLITMKGKFASRNLTLPNNKYVWQNLVDATNPVTGSVGSGSGGRLAFPKLLAQEGVQAYITLQTEAVTVTRLMCPRIPRTAIKQLANRINTNSFSILDATYEPECLKFIDADYDTACGPNGWRGWTLTYQFEAMLVYDWCQTSDSGGSGSGPYEDYVGWNRLYSPIDRVWDYVVLASDHTTGIHRYDGDISQTLAVSGGGTTDVTGFNLLFDSRAT